MRRISNILRTFSSPGKPRLGGIGGSSSVRIIFLSEFSSLSSLDEDFLFDDDSSLLLSLKTRLLIEIGRAAMLVPLETNKLDKRPLNRFNILKLTY